MVVSIKGGRNIMAYASTRHIDSCIIRYFRNNPRVSICDAPSDEGFSIHKNLYCRRQVVLNFFAASPYSYLLESTMRLHAKRSFGASVIAEFSLVNIVAYILGYYKRKFKNSIFYSDIASKENVVLEQKWKDRAAGILAQSLPLSGFVIDSRSKYSIVSGV